jgi:hypothetical protein
MAILDCGMSILDPSWRATTVPKLMCFRKFFKSQDREGPLGQPFLTCPDRGVIAGAARNSWDTPKVGFFGIGSDA